MSPSRLIFLITFTVYVIGINSLPPKSSNEWAHYAIVDAISRHHGLEIEHSILWHLHQDVIQVNGKCYSVVAPGAAFLAIPLFLVGLILGLPQQFVLLYSVVCTALTATLIFHFSRLLGSGSKTSFLTGFTYGFGTLAWTYSKTFSAHPTSALILTLATYILASKVLRRARDDRSFFVSGALFGLAFLVENQNAIFLFPALLYLFSTLDRSRLKKAVPILLAGFSLTGASMLLYNYVLFTDLFVFPESIYRGGSLLESLNAPICRSLPELLYEPSKGILYLSPVLMFSIPGFILLWQQKFRSETLFLASLFIVDLAFFSKWYAWYGGVCYGPRFLVSVIPFLIIPLSKVFDKFYRRHLFWVMFTPAFIWSITTAAVGFLGRPMHTPGADVIETYQAIRLGLPCFCGCIPRQNIDSWLLGGLPGAYLPFVLIFMETMIIAVFILCSRAKSLQREKTIC